MIQKIAVFLVFCLLSQNLLFAQTTDQAKSALALAQEQARQDVQQKPWIQREGLWVLSTFGVSVGLLVVQEIRHRFALNRIATEETIRRIAAAEISRELTQAKGALGALESENIRLKNMNHDLLEGREYFKGQIADLEGKLQGEKFLTGTYKTRSEGMALDLKEFQLFELADIEKIEKQSKTIARKLMKGQALTEAEAKLLMEGTDPATAQKILQALQSNTASVTNLEVAFGNIVRAHPEKVSAKTLRFFQKIAKEMKAPMIIALLLSLSVNQNTAQAQDWEDRLNHNFDLFLQATPQELAEIERLGLADLCIEGAQAIHEMAEMDEYTQQEIQAGISEPKKHQDLRQVSSY